LENSNLVQILQTLSRQEWRDLEKWLRSPVHNTHPEVTQLFWQLREQISGGEKLETAAMGRLVAPARADSVDHLHHLKSYLMKSVEDFLLWSAWNAGAVARQQTLAVVYRRRQLGKLAQRARRNAAQLQQSAPARDLDHFEKNVRLEYEAIRQAEQEHTAQTQDLQPLLDAQDIRFALEKLQTGCLMLSQMAVSPRAYDRGLLDPLLRFLENHRHLQIPAIALYYHGYQALLEPGADGHFQHFKALLQEHGPSFEGEELRNLYLLAVNFCIRRLNRQERAYLREVFDLYQSGIALGVFLENGQLSRFTYTNIAQAGMGLGEFLWVAGFLEQYKKYLPVELREPVSNFNLARLYYETGRPAEAMRCLLRVEHDDIIHNLAAKTLLAKIYFEQGEFNALDSLLDSIEAYIRRKKVLGYHRDNYLGFVRMLRLLHTTEPGNAAKRAEIRQKIAGAKVLAEREWLTRITA
jgi:hypothetical protein